MKFLHWNEVSIKLVINEASYQKDKQEQSEKYIQYLCLFVKLMCELERNPPGDQE